MYRAVYLITYLDTQTGGMERQALQLAERLQESGYGVCAITCAHITKMKKDGLRIRDYKNGIRIYRIPLLPGWRRLNIALYTAGSIVFLIALRKRYDIIHAHQLHTSGLIASLARVFLPSKKVIVKNAAGGMYGDVGNIKKFPASGRVFSFLVRKVDCAVAVNGETEQEMRECGFSSIVRIPNGVEIDYFTPFSDMGHRERRVVLFVGNLEPVKNVPVLIDALALLSSNMVLTIVGRGTLRFDLEQYASERGVRDRVTFAGVTNDVRPFYQTADAFVLPSHSEGVPNTLLEAMSSGLPVVCSDIPAVRGIITHEENGYLFQKNDPHELAQHLTRIFDSPLEAARLGRAARVTVEQRFSFVEVSAQYLSLYRSVCGTS